MPDMNCSSGTKIDRRKSMKLLLGGLCSATSASSAGAMTFGVTSQTTMATSDGLSLVAKPDADLRMHGSVSRESKYLPFSIAINTYGCRLPEWATPQSPRSELFLELVAVAANSTNGLEGSVDQQSRVTFFEQALATPYLPSSLINIAVQSGELDDAMEGFVSTFVSDGFIGIDWADVRHTAGIGSRPSDTTALPVRAIEAQAFVLPGLAQSGGMLAKEVRRKLQSLAEAGFGGGVLINSRIADPNRMDWTLQGLDEFFSEALADREDRCAAATIDSKDDRVCVYAFQQHQAV